MVNFDEVIQLISQLKGYFYINPILALSLAITIFSFVGIPPLLGFFAKQMVLSAALDNGYIFLSLVAILTSVIGAVYYLSIIKEMFFFSSEEYKINPLFSFRIEELREGEITVTPSDLSLDKDVPERSFLSGCPIPTTHFRLDVHYRIVMSSPLAITISIISLIILLFIFMNKEWLSMGTILVQFLFNS